MCRKFSVENIGVENFSLKMEKWPVENFLSKIVMFAERNYFTVGWFSDYKVNTMGAAEAVAVIYNTLRGEREKS